MFFRCSSLLSLPEISKWNISKVYDMDGMFAWCSSLSSLPDISKWETKNVSMKFMFLGCNNKIIKIFQNLIDYFNIK